MNNKTVTYKYRFLARLIIEAKTPLAVGSGEKDIITDQLVARDINGLPYIPGTAIAGILRHAVGEENAKTFFGFNESKKDRKKRIKSEKESGKQASEIKENIDEGSEIIFSSAQMVGCDGKAVEGLILDVFDDKYLNHFKELPIRQHVSIGSNGTAKERGKFDEEVVYKGTRFCFEIELLSKENDNQNFQNILTELSKDTISIGGGTRKGFGKISIVECKTKALDLTNKQDLDLYIYKTSFLNDDFWEKVQEQPITKPETEAISICLKPKDFILIGSGFGSDLADTTPTKENAVIWEDGTPQLKSFYVLPGTSIKGALAHRTDYYYCQKGQIFLEDLFEQNADFSKIESKCKKELFGSVEDKAIPGNIFISDVFIPCASSSLDVQPHVVIDAFTGGAAKGKLFQEELLKINEPILISIQILKKEYSPFVRDAFNMAIEDLKTGMLALGASTNRGHGTFLKTNKQ